MEIVHEIPVVEIFQKETLQEDTNAVVAAGMQAVIYIQD